MVHKMSSAEPYLKELLAIAVAEHTHRKDRVRKVAWTIRIAVMFLGMTSTILLGLSFSNVQWYASFSRNIALVCGAITTFLTGLAAFWNLDSYWLKRKVLLTRLKALQSAFDFSLAQHGSLTDAVLEEFFRRYMAVIGEQTQYWETLLARTTPNEKPPAGQQSTEADQQKQPS